LEWIANAVGTPENYTFSTTSQTLLDPFTSTNFGSPAILQSVTVAGLGIAHQFQYDTSAEMTQLTTPLGGTLSWTYRTNAYAARNYREVGIRYMQAIFNGTRYGWNIDHDGVACCNSTASNPNWHTSAVVADWAVGSQKVYTFSTSSDYTAGLTTKYQEIDSTSTVLPEKDYRWYQSSSGNPYVGKPTTTLNPGASYAASTSTSQVIDGYGNLTVSQVHDYATSTTGERTYNMTYQTQYWGWPAYYIYSTACSPQPSCPVSAVPQSRSQAPPTTPPAEAFT
jgi:hypothetical protein